MSFDLSGQLENKCFACGPHNRIGLKLRPQLVENRCEAKFTPTEDHQGWNNYMHGGLITTLLDEVMGNCLWQQEKPSVTAEINVRFLKPVPIGKEIKASGWIVNEKNRLAEMEAVLVLEDGVVAAKASAKFIKMGRGFTGEQK